MPQHDIPAASLEDGYTRIANTLLDAILAFDFTKRQQAVLFAIIRKTYGYNKSEDDIGLSQLEAITKIDRANVSRTVSELVSMNVVQRVKGEFGHRLKVNKAHQKWGCQIGKNGGAKSATVVKLAIAKSATEGLPNRQDPCCQIDKTPVAKLATTKDNHTKDNHTKDNLQKVSARPLTPAAPTPEQVAARDTWAAYSLAYRTRYGIDPIRNAKTNSLISQFVRRVPLDEAASIARYYLTLAKGWYMSKGHDLASLLADAEAVRTQWATGRRTTDTLARQADQTQATGQVFLDLIAKAELEGASHG